MSDQQGTIAITDGAHGSVENWPTNLSFKEFVSNVGATVRLE